MMDKQILRALDQIDDGYIEELYDSLSQGEEKRPGRKRGLSFYLLAAVIAILAAALTAGAARILLDADQDWFFDFFSSPHSETARETVNENQNALLDKGLVAIGQSVTCGGYTVTLESALSDGYRVFAKFVVEAPEGTVLDGNRYFLEDSFTVELAGEEELGFGMAMAAGTFLEDEDPADNRISLLLDIILQPDPQTAQAMPEGTVWHIQITSIKRDHVTLDEYNVEEIAAGEWNFTFAFDKNTLLTREWEILSQPIRCTGERTLRQWEFPVTVKLTSFRLRALTATCTYAKPLTGYWDGIMLDPIYVVLKDGTRVEAHFKLGSYKGDHCEITYMFAVPIVAEDVDYVEFPGEKNIEL